MGRLAQHHRDIRRRSLPSARDSVSVGGASCELDDQGRVRCDFAQGRGSSHKLDPGCYVNTSLGVWHCPGVPALHGKPVSKIHRLSSDAPSGHTWADIDEGTPVPAFPVSVGARRSTRFKKMARNKKFNPSLAAGFPRNNPATGPIFISNGHLCVGVKIDGEVAGCCINPKTGKITCDADTPVPPHVAAALRRAYANPRLRHAAAAQPSSPAVRAARRRAGRAARNNPSLAAGFPRNNPSLAAGFPRNNNPRHRNAIKPSLSPAGRITAAPTGKKPSPAPDCCIDEATGLITCQGGAAAFYMHGRTVSKASYTCRTEGGQRICSVSAGGDVSYDMPACPPIPAIPHDKLECCVDAATSTLQQCSDPAMNGTPVKIVQVNEATGTVIVGVPWQTDLIEMPLCFQPPLRIPPTDKRPPQCCVDAETSTLQNCDPPEYNGTPVKILDVDESTGTVMVGVPWSSTPVRMPLCPEIPPTYIPPEGCPPGYRPDPLTGGCCPEPQPCPECPTCPPGFLLNTQTGECVQCPECPPPRACPPPGDCPPCEPCPEPGDCPPCEPCPPGPDCGPCIPTPGPTPCGDAPCPVPPEYGPPPGAYIPPGGCQGDGPCPVPGAPYPPPPGSYIPPCCENNAMGLPCPHRPLG